MRMSAFRCAAMLVVAAIAAPAGAQTTGDA
jgi:hypothetical protein